MPRLTRLPGEGLLLISFVRKGIEAGVNMLARLPGARCLLARGTRLGGVAFCHETTVRAGLSRVTEVR